MALSGIFYGTTSNQYVKPKIEWSAVQSIEGNYSDVTAILTYSRTNTGYVTSSTWLGGITIDGVRQSGSGYAEVTYNSNTEVFRCTQRVYHDADGFRDVTISADGYFYNTKTQDTAISATVMLDQIPRAAKVAATDANIGAVSTVSITGLNTGYQYTLAVSFGSLTGYLNAAGELLSVPVLLTAGSIPFTVPEDFYYEIPDAPSGVCTLTCTTWLDGQQIGDVQTGMFTATAAKENCAPVVTGTVLDVNEVTVTLTGDSRKLVQNASTALCTISVEARYGASITEKRIAGVVVEGDTLQILSVPVGEIAFQAVDSRGHNGNFTVKASEVIPYVCLNLNVSIARTDPTSGNATLTVNGQCYYGSFGAEDNSLTLIYTVNGGEEVSQALQIGEDGTYSAALALTGLDYEAEHTVRVWAVDAVGATEVKALTVGKGIPVFDWGENDFNFHVPVNFGKGLTVAGKSLADLIYPVGSIYMSVNAVDPAALFGGTWEQLKDRFLLAAGDIYKNGAEGGEAEHALTGEEGPTHKHNGMMYTHSSGAVHYVSMNSGSSGYKLSWTGASAGAGRADMYTVEAGGGQPHNNMPPYLAVNMWKRTA